LLVSCRGQLGSRCRLEAWRITLLCLMWCIWREWNKRSFEDSVISVLELKVIMFKSLYASYKKKKKTKKTCFIFLVILGLEIVAYIKPCFRLFFNYHLLNKLSFKRFLYFPRVLVDFSYLSGGFQKLLELTCLSLYP
jgi:hypothetical protein